jgi:prefoldin alpha subunit
MTEPTKRQMFEAELTQQEIERIQEQFAKIEQQRAEIAQMRTALDEFLAINEGDELLVPLASGVFARAAATADKMLRVNVGQGVVVHKSVDDVRAMLDTQEREMEQYEEGLHKRFDEALLKLQTFEAQLRPTG